MSRKRPPPRKTSSKFIIKEEDAGSTQKTLINPNLLMRFEFTIGVVVEQIARGRSSSRVEEQKECTMVQILLFYILFSVLRYYIIKYICIF